MKKLIATLLVLFAFGNIDAQVRIGIKGGVNFADLEGNFDTSMRTGFHAGAVLEIKIHNFALEPELMYSTQGAKVDVGTVKNYNFDYVTVPVLVKYYVLSDTFSIEAGPQFAFLVDDNISKSIVNTYDTKSFDFAVVGGVGLNITKSLFAQAHYVVGLTDASTSAFSSDHITNRVIQFSLGYMF